MTEEINIFQMAILWNSYLQLFRVRSKLSNLQQKFNTGTHPRLKLHERALYILHSVKHSGYFLERLRLSSMRFLS